MLRALRGIGRLTTIFVLAMAIQAGSPSGALAQRKGVNDKIMEEDTSKSYVLPYAIVVLGVALGVIIVARPSTRFDQPKRRLDEDDEN